MQPTDAATTLPPPFFRFRENLVESCQSLRGHRLPWLAVAFGVGVGLYFALPVEPPLVATACLAGLTLLLLAAGIRLRGSIGFLPLMVAVALSGLVVAQARTAVVAGPVLQFRYYGAIEGRVVIVDRSASGAPRLTLDRVRLDRFAPQETPHRVRVSMQTDDLVPFPGTRVMTTGHLSPPAGPTEPGGFDFQRHAWFQGLGAVGYTRVPVLRAEALEGGTALAVARFRQFLGDGLRARIPGQAGQVAAAITTGDRAGLSSEVTEALRASNLAHLLAISGLHMGLLVGFVFWAIRGGFALVPSLALNYPTRVWAAAAALPFALAYLFLSGGTVATQRAFIMAAVMLGAILLGRRALSIRSVAIAAILVLLWRPESLTGPGFQMSFAATGALVLAFGALSRSGRGSWMRGWKGAFLSLLLSSLVAGFATGPIAALHFNRVGQFGVLANLLAVPVMGFAIMPLLFLGLLLWPLGLESGPFWIARQGIDWILWVADWVANLPGAVSYMSAPSWQVLPVLGLGMAVLGASRGPWGRGGGLVALVTAAFLWVGSDRPDLLISDDGRLVGAMTENGRWLNRETGVGFVAQSWLENDGDGALQVEAGGRLFHLPLDWPQIHAAPTPGQMADFVDDCAVNPGLLIGPAEIADVPDGCVSVDAAFLKRTGAVAIRFEQGSIRMQTVSEFQGMRPWTPKR